MQILTHRRYSVPAMTNILSHALCKNTVRKVLRYEITRTTIKARQTVINLNTAAQVLPSTISSKSCLIRSHSHWFSRHKTLTVRGILDVSSCLPFHITVSSFSNMSRQLPKNLIIAHTEPPSPNIYYCRKTLSNNAAIRTVRNVGTEHHRQGQ